MRIFLATAVITALVGCAAPKHNYVAESKAFSEPPIGAVVVANVGDKMVSQGKYVKHDAIVVREEFQLSYAHIVGAGIYTKTGDDTEAEYFSPKIGDGGRLARTSALFDLPASLMLRRNGELCVVTVTSQFVCGKPGPIERRKLDMVTQDTFQQTLIYSGKIGNKINVGYREFTSDIARMAFNNNVEYDLSESKIIGYKGAEIEIIDATNREIRYRVIRNFNTETR